MWLDVNVRRVLGRVADAPSWHGAWRCWGTPWLVRGRQVSKHTREGRQGILLPRKVRGAATGAASPLGAVGGGAGAHPRQPHGAPARAARGRRARGIRGAGAAPRGGRCASLARSSPLRPSFLIGRIRLPSMRIRNVQRQQICVMTTTRVLDILSQNGVCFMSVT